jgi:hypothetical protein
MNLVLRVSDLFGFAAAEKLGLPFVPPYIEQSMRMGVGSVGLTNIDGMIQGVNYASAAAGILSSSGSELVCPPPNINLTIIFVVLLTDKSVWGVSLWFVHFQYI